mgnify:CR=1 FL=1
MIQVTYISRTREPMGAEALLNLLMQCRENNEKSDITGLLLYGNETFLQVLEGDNQVVDDLVSEILKDPRHADIEVINRKVIDQRDYAEWRMGFDLVSNEGLAEVRGLTDFGAARFNFDYLVGHGPVVESLLEHYREPHFDQVMGELDAQDRVIRHLQGALKDLRNRSQVARLALASVIDASRDGAPSESLIRLCESALEGLCPKD